MIIFSPIKWISGGKMFAILRKSVYNGEQITYKINKVARVEIKSRLCNRIDVESWLQALSLLLILASWPKATPARATNFWFISNTQSSQLVLICKHLNSYLSIIPNSPTASFIF